MPRNTEKKEYFAPGFPKDSQVLKDLKDDARERGRSVNSVIEERIFQFYEARRLGVSLQPSTPTQLPSSPLEQEPIVPKEEDPMIEKARKKRNAVRNW